MLMEKMMLKERKLALIKLGEYLQRDDDYLNAIIRRSSLNNAWFTENAQRQAIDAIATQMLEKQKLEKWLADYEIPDAPNQKILGLVMAGNLPLVGFHDLLCVFISGHKAMIKLSDKDPYLLPAILKALGEIDERTASYFDIVERLKGFEAVIATGSNNTARYFEAYFGKYPNIIRKNRNGIAVFDGKETAAELLAFGRDYLDYFGLGCRNVSKIYVPKNFDFDPLLEALHEYRTVVRHTKYKNNFDYQYALYILNKVELKANGCVLMTENKAIQSPIACLHYEYYEDVDQLSTELQLRLEEIQLIVSRLDFKGLPVFPFGEAQKPALSDYADGVDTIKFLLSI